MTPPEIKSPKHDSGPPQEDAYIPARTTRTLCGGVSDMTLWRWLNSSKLDFPEPIRINGRRYWRRSEVNAWLTAQRALIAFSRLAEATASMRPSDQQFEPYVSPVPAIRQKYGLGQRAGQASQSARPHEAGSTDEGDA